MSMRLSECIHESFSLIEMWPVSGAMTDSCLFLLLLIYTIADNTQY